MKNNSPQINTLCSQVGHLFYTKHLPGHFQCKDVYLFLGILALAFILFSIEQTIA
jgi:hypothetical protein